MFMIFDGETSMYILMGVLSASSFMVIVWRTGHLRKALGYPVVMDVVALSAMVALLHDTIVGTLIAIVAALTFSAAIGVLRWLCGWERLVRLPEGRRWVSCRAPMGGHGYAWSYILRRGNNA